MENNLNIASEIGGPAICIYTLLHFASQLNCQNLYNSLRVPLATLAILILPTMSFCH